MLKILPTLLVLTGLIIAPSLQAQDLAAVYGKALKNDAELQVAEADYTASIAVLPLARSSRLPQIFFSADATVGESNINAISGSGSNSQGYAFGLTQSLYDNNVTAEIDAAEARVESAKARLSAARESLILRVAQTYFTILAAHDAVEFANAERNAIERQLEQAQKRFEVGLIAITDVHEAQARFDTADAAAILADNLQKTAYQRLEVITADSSNQALHRLGSNIDFVVPKPANIDTWVKTAMSNNRALQIARQDLKVARADRLKSDRNRYPTINMSATFSDRDSNDDSVPDSDREDLSVSIALDLPLYQGGRLGAARAQANADYRSSKSLVLLQNRLTAQQTRIAFLDVVSGISQVKALKQALDSSNIALQATQAGFDVGTRTSVDVLISLRETYRARRDYSSSRYDYLINTLILRQASGVLNDNHLLEINRWLVRH